MTQLSEKDNKAQMDDMKSFDEQMSCVGIFWHDSEEQSLLGVRKKELTPKMVEEAAKKGIYRIDYPEDDYTQVPHGRVVWNVNKFIVLVGKWAEPI